MTVSFYTLGCKVNQYDTQAIREMFLAKGISEDKFEEADICVINTCTVTAIADKKSRNMINRALKRGARVIVCGCLAQSAHEEIKQMGVWAVVGNASRKDIADIALGNISQEKVDDISKENDFEELNISNSHEKIRGFIKIQEGCDNFCSYCAIPYVRGKSRSRSFENIISEAKRLIDNGILEIVFLGIHVDDYCFLSKYLIDVIEEVAKVNENVRIRLGSLHPKCFEKDFLSRAVKVKNLCPHFHISLQSGCDSVLSRMNRIYTTSEYYECLCKIREVYMHPAITTDIITGFCGETIDEFNATKEFVKKCGFAKIHVFPYSRREGTKAFNMQDNILKKQKNLRVNELIAIGNTLEKEFCAKFIGTKQKVLFEQTTASGLAVGYTDRYIKLTGEGNINEYGEITIKEENIVL